MDGVKGRDPLCPRGGEGLCFQTGSPGQIPGSGTQGRVLSRVVPLLFDRERGGRARSGLRARGVPLRPGDSVKDTIVEAFVSPGRVQGSLCRATPCLRRRRCLCLLIYGRGLIAPALSPCRWPPVWSFIEHDPSAPTATDVPSHASGGGPRPPVPLPVRLFLFPSVRRVWVSSESVGPFVTGRAHRLRGFAGRDTPEGQTHVFPAFLCQSTLQ